MIAKFHCHPKRSGYIGLQNPRQINLSRSTSCRNRALTLPLLTILYLTKPFFKCLYPCLNTFQHGTVGNIFVSECDCTTGWICFVAPRCHGHTRNAKKWPQQTHLPAPRRTADTPSLRAMTARVARPRRTRQRRARLAACRPQARSMAMTTQLLSSRL